AGEYMVLSGSRNTGLGLFALAVMLTAIGEWVRRKKRQCSASLPVFWKAGWAHIAVIIIIIITIGVKFYRFEAAPEGLAFDEAVKGAVAANILTGNVSFEPYIAMKESPFYYLVAFFMWLFGYTTAAMRLTATAFAAAGLLLMHGLLRRMFDFRVAFVSSVLMTVSLWHNTVSRICQRLVLLPLVTAMVMLCIYKIHKTGRWYWFMLLGFTAGAGFYTYPPMKIFLVIIIPVLIYEICKRPRWVMQQWLKTILSAACFLLLLTIPLGRDAFRFPSVHFSAAPFGYADQSYHLPDNLTYNLKDLLWTWHSHPLHGGTKRPINIPFPLLDPVTGVFFLIGLAVCVMRIRRFPEALLLFGFLAGVMPGVLFTPFQRRLVIATFLAFPISALGFIHAAESVFLAFQKRQFGRRCAACSLALILWLPVVSGWKILNDKLFHYDRYYAISAAHEYTAKLVCRGYDVMFCGRFDPPRFNLAYFQETHDVAGNMIKRVRNINNLPSIPLHSGCEHDMAILMTRFPSLGHFEKKLRDTYPHVMREDHRRGGQIVYIVFLIPHEDIETSVDRRNRSSLR
ncbi:glycosyltransferase family 39 protein, partial [bacterium]|nr:glycosyltransferase family 39 protein [candidate division CSSED10-310 bacterium]